MYYETLSDIEEYCYKNNDYNDINMKTNNDYK